jgi:putative intracellular protease/amidase
MLHAVTVPGGTAERTIFPDCEKLGKIVRARAAKFADE